MQAILSCQLACQVFILCCMHLDHHEVEGSDSIYAAGRGALHRASEGRQVAHSHSAGLKPSQHSEASCAIR